MPVEGGAADVEAHKQYDLAELIDLAERNEPRDARSLGASARGRGCGGLGEKHLLTAAVIASARGASSTHRCPRRRIWCLRAISFRTPANSFRPSASNGCSSTSVDGPLYCRLPAPTPSLPTLLSLLRTRSSFTRLPRPISIWALRAAVSARHTRPYPPRPASKTPRWPSRPTVSPPWYRSHRRDGSRRRLAISWQRRRVRSASGWRIS